MIFTPNPSAVLLKPTKTPDEVKLSSGLILTKEQDKNSLTFDVVAVGNKFDKRFDITSKSKVVVSGGNTVVIDDIPYLVALESQILLVINK